MGDALPALKSAQKLTAVPAAADGGAMLVLVHGTFCDTKGTFERLWTDHPGGPKLVVGQTYDEKDEAQTVAREVLRLFAEGDHRLGEPQG